MFKIAICTINSPDAYSGGRYHAWMMAEALSEAGYEVWVITNNIPLFYNDFSSYYPRHSDIHICLTDDFETHIPDEHFDVVVLVPHLGDNLEYFYKVQLLAYKNRARLIFLNFETPNWFNTLSPVKRAPSLWREWYRTCKSVDLILSSCREGTKFARQFYSVQDKTLFRDCPPSINSRVADSIEVVHKEKQIICITRFGDKHKGAEYLLDVLSPSIKGYKLVVVVGAGGLSKDFSARLEDAAGKYGVSVSVLQKLTDAEKFYEIKRSRLMLFLSYFEGFGIPPVEALYCNVPCIAFELPVLREINGDGLIYVNSDNTGNLSREIAKVINQRFGRTDLHSHIAPIAKFENYVTRIDKIVNELMSQETAPAICKSRWQAWKWKGAVVTHRFKPHMKVGKSILHSAARKLNILH